jgi:YHS domain-containing protein
MEMLLTIAVWAGLFFVMMRFGCGSHLTGRNHKNATGNDPLATMGTPELRWVPAEKDIDPVCKKTVATRAAKSCVHEGKVYYFCSRDCREVFEAAPDIYTDTGDTNQNSLEHAHV